MFIATFNHFMFEISMIHKAINQRVIVRSARCSGGGDVKPEHKTSWRSPLRCNILIILNVACANS